MGGDGDGGKKGRKSRGKGVVYNNNNNETTTKTICVHVCA